VDHVALRGADDPGVCGADVAGGTFVAARGLGVGHCGILPVGNAFSVDSPASSGSGLAEPCAGGDFSGVGGHSGSGHRGQCCGLFGVSGLCAVGIYPVSGALFLGMCQS